MNIQDGTYRARPVAASISESKAGNLMAVIRFGIENGPELTFYSVLVKQDGTVNTRNLEDLKRWSGWDGSDPYWLMDTDLTGLDVELVIENEPSITDPSRLWPSVKWVNPPGGGLGGLPEPADRRAVMERYGAKFRALAGGVSVGSRLHPQGVSARPGGQLAVGSGGRTPGAQRPTPGPLGNGQDGSAASPRAPSCLGRADQRSATTGGESAHGAGVPVAGGPPERPAASIPAPSRPASTQASAWNLLCELGKSISQTEREGLWFGFVDATGMDQTDMTATGWAQVEKAIRDYFAGQAAGPSVAGPANAGAEDDLPY